LAASDDSFGACAAILQAAASILGVEAYHAGAIRTALLYANVTATTPYGPVSNVVQLISDLRDAVDGPSDDDQGIDIGGMSNLVPTDESSLVFARTIPNVLNIVYLGACLLLHWLAVVAPALHAGSCDCAIAAARASVELFCRPYPCCVTYNARARADRGKKVQAAWRRAVSSPTASTVSSAR
jgi:Ferritin-like domain